MNHDPSEKPDLRDAVAAAALTGILSAPKDHPGSTQEARVELAYAYADLMLAKRKALKAAEIESKRKDRESRNPKEPK